jgi:hypothetical protein
VILTGIKKSVHTEDDEGLVTTVADSSGKRRRVSFNGIFLKSDMMKAVKTNNQKNASETA